MLVKERAMLPSMISINLNSMSFFVQKIFDVYQLEHCVKSDVRSLDPT